jgi:hypothetical protein
MPFGPISKKLFYYKEERKRKEREREKAMGSGVLGT